MKAQLLHQETSVTPLTLGINHRGFHHRLHVKYTGLYFKPSFIVYKNRRVDWYGDMSNFRDLGNSVIAKVRKDAHFSQRLLREMRSTGRKLTAWNNRILKTDMKKTSAPQLARLLSTQYRLANDICDLGAVAVYPDLRHNILSRLLKNIINNKIKRRRLKRNANEYFSILITPHLSGLAQQEKTAVLEFTDQVRADRVARTKWVRLNPKQLSTWLKQERPKDYKKLQAIYGQFKWSSYGHLGPAKTFENYLGDVRAELKSKGFAKELKNSRRQLAIIVKKQSRYLRELQLSAVDKRLFLAARDFSENKVYRYNGLLHTWYTLTRLLVEVSQRTGYTVTELRYMSVEEITNALLEGGRISRRELNARQRFCVVVVKGWSVQHLVGLAAQSYIRHNVEPEAITGDVRTLHGSVAFIGRVTGRAKIVNHPAEIKKVKRGDIMVSTQTSPELMPAMRLAAAFVTDIGGITSHAAIIARELKKPCVIGTKIATRIFKDGDLVDVDAIKGNVTYVENQ